VFVGEGDITGFAAVGTIVEAVDAEPDIVLAFAYGAILFADAVFLAFVALRTENLLAIGSHRTSRRNFT
jgi:hypothetical protein